MKEYLIDTFRYNSWANLKLLEAIRQMPEMAEGVRLFSHMINAQDIWFSRVNNEVVDKPQSWLNEAFPVEELEERWTTSTNKWLEYLDSKTEADLDNQIVFHRLADKKAFQVKVVDVILQINYHSIHHRAQLLRLIREQGGVPPGTDYILTKISEVV
jgi:uncharacterized damage-inducible protein DinB